MKKYVISVCGVKGGITKSTLSYCLAVYYSEHLGLPVSLLDLDSRNLSLYNKFRGNNNIFNRPMNKYFTLSDKIEIKNGFITIADLPGNDGLTRDGYLDFIFDSDIVIFPTTPDKEDMRLLLKRSIEDLGDKRQNRYMIYNKVTNKIIEQYDNYDKLDKNNITVIKEFIYNDKKLFDNLGEVIEINGKMQPLISTEKMLNKLLTKHLGFRELVQDINYKIFINQ